VTAPTARTSARPHRSESSSTCSSPDSHHSIQSTRGLQPLHQRHASERGPRVRPNVRQPDGHHPTTPRPESHRRAWPKPNP
jgi:hypothetical protein